MAQVATTSAEYKFSPQYNDYIAPFTTEIWARVYRPSTLASGQRYPVILMLHGMHNTCGKNNTTPRVDDNNQYAINGTCPNGYSVVKQHEGYAYLANDLASRGYIVVSINANRGIHNDGNAPSYDIHLERARGRLVLWHLSLLSSWNTGASTTPSSLGVSLQNRLDLSQVGLMGHSRGAIGMRAAIASYRNDGEWQYFIPETVTFRALLEMSPPAERADPSIPDAYDVAFLHMVGLCDGELSSYTEQSVINTQFDRQTRLGTESSAYFKAAYGIHGANHRYFNTQWQQNDVVGPGSSCANQTALFAGTTTETGSSSQQEAAKNAVRNFFMATVGTKKDPSLAKIFDPVYPVPSGSPTIVRAFTASPRYDNSLRLEEFTGPSGTNSNWVPNNSSGLSSYGHGTGGLGRSSDFPIGTISWGSASTSKYFQTNWSTSGWNLSGYRYLEFRVDQFTNTTPVEFSIQLVNGDNTRSSLVSSTSYVTLPALPGTTKSSPGQVLTFYHPILRTVRIPLSAFSGANLNSIRGARFVFNRTSNGSITLAGINATIDMNLARGRTVTTSSNESGSLSGANAVDGNTGTRWSSAHSENQWIRVDLGSSKSFKTVVLRWEAAYGKNYTIQTSNNGTSWTTVHTVTNASAGTHVLNLANTATGRYVRMNGTLRGTQWGYSLYEFEIYPN